MNLLMFSDLHLKKDELQECNLVLEEILMLCNKHNITEVYDLGDTFDKIKPESECLDAFATFIKKLNRPITILAAQSHESTTPEESIVNHFGILSDKVKVVKEYNDDNYLYLGHFIINEAKKNYGGAVPKSALAKYQHILLGHGHSYELIAPNICQLGSVRYVDFAESQDRAKVIVVCENYKSLAEKWVFIPLKAPYPMKDVIIDAKVSKTSPKAKSEGNKWQDVLNFLPAMTKIRVLFNDFESYSNSINELAKFKQKFVKFQIKKDFLLMTGSQKSESKEINLKESLNSYLEKNKINDHIKKILLEELK